jgi:2,4-dienoyl-CoA reductase-like NADH-dependent reductase (Old Yellow Enzyme family)
MPKNAAAIAKFVRTLKAINPKALFVFQLTHAGELSNPAFSRRVTVKNLPGYEGDLLSDEEVDRIMDEFVLASQIAHDAGADGIDMKFCHGYLGNQILRPYNDRKWKYGGSWGNRSRFAYDLYERIQKAVNDPNFLIGSKVSLWEGFPGGFGSASPDSPVMDMTEPIDFIKNLDLLRRGGPRSRVHDVYARLLCESPEEDLQAGNGHYRLSLRSVPGWQKYETGRDESSRHGAIRVRGQMHSRRCDGHGGPRPAVPG